ncbi:MAG: glycosyltransferase family 39 protein [Anaerolineae bacterium]|nr:glycosyltransferase family 39 protein [Anaerolineae bacterium]
MTRLERSAALLFAAVLVLALTALHTYHFHGRDFREDEIYTVHAAQIMNTSEVVQWIGTGGVHPAGWRVIAVWWVQVFGEAGLAEPVVRHFSTLVTLLALALVWRLGADLGGWTVGGYAAFVLGTLPFAQFYMGEFRPYSALVLVTAGLTLTLLRWIRRPTFARALLFVAFGVAALQTHYYAGYALAGLVAAFLLLVRWERGLYLRALGLFAAIGLSFSAWLLPLAHRFLVGAGGVTYAMPSDWRFFRELHGQMMLEPAAIGHLLLAVGVLIVLSAALAGGRSYPGDCPLSLQTSPPQGGKGVARVLFSLPLSWEKGWGWGAKAGGRFRFGAAGPALILLIAPGVALTLAFLINRFGTGNATPKNLIILVPFMALVAALGLRRLPWQARLAAILLLTYPALTEFRTYRTNAPYRELVAFMTPAYQPGDRVIAHVNDYAASTQALAYYLDDRLPGGLDRADTFHIGGSSHRYPFDPIAQQVFTSDPATLARFAQFLDEAQRAWLITYNRTDLLDPFLDALGRAFGDARRAVLRNDTNVYEIVEYRRVPADLRDVARFGEAIYLRGWSLPDGVSVRACQDVPFESWWYVADAPGAGLGIGLVLADANGQGVARADAEPSGTLTVAWRADSYHLDGRALRIPCDLPPGDYPLLIGLHDLVTAQALPAFAPDNSVLGSPLVYLTTLSVSGP